MKVDIITFQAAYNYGAVLQAFATQEFFRQNGCSSRIIKVVFPYVKPFRRAVSISLRGSAFVFPLKIIPALLASYMAYFRLESFRKKHLIMTEKQYSSREELAAYESDADAFCTGSDQIWSPVFGRDLKPYNFLAFAPEGSYKFSFASSFGVSRLSPEEAAETEKYISSYKHISVREDTGLEILKEQCHYDNAVQIMDPTLCLDGNVWRKYVKNTTGGGGYILVYNLTSGNKLNDYAELLTAKTGLRLIHLCTSWRQFSACVFRRQKKVIIPSVPDFISLISNAKYVITDSFHGTAFSLNLNTEPICIYPRRVGGRIESILRLTGTEHRHLESYEDFDVINRPVDFSQVNSVLDGERKKASDWLKMVLAEIGQHNS